MLSILPISNAARWNCHRMEALGMTVTADNTPERLVEFMRRETARQGALAKLWGHQPMAPQQLRAHPYTTES